MKRKFIVTFIFILILLAACGQVDDTPATDNQVIKIRLPMGYIPSIQHSPFYVAMEKGYFKEAGFEIQLDYGNEADGVALVGANEVPFAIVSGEQVLLARAQGIPVVYIMAWFQDTPITVVSKVDIGIEKISDLAGHTIGIPGPFGASYIGLKALLSEAGISESEITLESIGFTQVEAFVGGQSEIIVGYVSNEPIQLRELGYSIVEFPVSNYVKLAANGIITNETMIADNPEMVQLFVDAVLKGLADAISDPEEAYEISLKYVESLSEQNKDVQMKILAFSIEYWNAEILGLSEAAAWENMQAVLLEMGLLLEPLDLDAAFTNQFIE